MVSLHDKNPGEVLSNHVLPIKLLAQVKDIEVIISESTRASYTQSVDYTFMTEFVLLVARLINNTNRGGKIFVYPLGKSEGDKNTWCTLESSHFSTFTLKDIIFGLNLKFNKKESGNQVTIDIHFPNQTVIKFDEHSVDNNDNFTSNINKPFYSSLHSSLKGNDNFSRDLLIRPDPTNLENDRFLQKINQFIINNLNKEKLDVNKLCRELMISRSQLYRKMKSLLRKSPAQHIRFIKLSYAKQILEKTTDSVGDIAFKLGYSDQSHFTRSFKKQFGYYPSYYRQQSRLNLNTPHTENYHE